MTHDELVDAVENYGVGLKNGMVNAQMAFNVGKAMRALLALHQPVKVGQITSCNGCYEEENGLSNYPCSTIKLIDKTLNG